LTISIASFSLILAFSSPSTFEENISENNKMAKSNPIDMSFGFENII
jgi:hypothetical protein